MNDDDEKWSKASFRVNSGSVSPGELARILGVLPDYSHHTGDPISRINPNLGFRRVHMFTLKSDLPSSSPLEEHLTRLLDRIEPVLDRLRALGDRVELDLFCAFSSHSGQGGITMSPAVLQRLAKTELEFVLDLYPPELRDT